MKTPPHSFCPMRHSQRGFTLIELMVVVVMVAILLSVGLPSFSNFIVGQRVKTAAFDLASTLLLARSEAIKRNADVTVAPKVAADGWVGGWTVAVGTTTLSEQAAYGGITITNPSIPASVVYQGASGRPAAGKTMFTLSGGHSSRCVTVDLSGMTSTKTGACS
ncbi:MAG: GspH/FimT family pseudopilin [Rhodoferax sp.]